MSAFGKTLGTAIGVVLVAKVGLSVAFYADDSNVVNEQTIVKAVNSASEKSESHNDLATRKEDNSTNVAVN